VENETLLRLLDVIWVTFHKATQIVDHEDSEPMTTYRQHRCILEAVLDGDVGEATTRLRDHYAGLERRLARGQ
jgi:DNA-binding FadR family transcriptional regulator